VECDQPSRLVFTFDEILSGQDVDFKRLGCVNAVVYELQPGRYQLESFEPYTLRYLKLMVLDGACRIKNIYLREYANSQTSQAQFSCDDTRLNKIFEAACQTFRQNAVDIFMDCPSRERAGWLCDSFFTARVAKDLCGHSTIEKNFLENFLLPAKFEFLPAGMLPMCYPADHNDGVFIPNWAMWFVIELQEYLARTEDRELVDALQPKVLALLDYFKRFQNEDGLLENLQSWVFVEWSKANEFVQNVNYPSNMLYAAVLEAAGQMYDQKNLLEQAETIRETIREKSYDGDFFTDNATRKDGQLQKTTNRTEVCQYYAFFFRIATPKSHPELWQKLTQEFGPKRDASKTWPEVHPANAFIGNYLRLELMSRNGLCRQLKNEIVDYFLYMADITGTLWENVGSYASCNHGFASHVAHDLYRDILGVYEINQQKKIVILRLSDVGLQWCEGTLPTQDGLLTVRWQKDGDTIQYQTQLPTGYQLKVETRGSVKALPEF
jgi:alpha-L-rhamnosidase